MDFSGRILPDMPYSVLLGSTVDTCLRQSTSSWFLLVAMHLALCSLALCRCRGNTPSITYSTMRKDLTDPVSYGKYSGIFVFTAPVAEPIVLSFTVPSNGCTIVATASGVTSFFSSADCFGSAANLCCESVCVAMSCGGGFTPGGAYDSVWDSVNPMTGNYFFNYFQYQEFVGCVCMLNFWFSSNDEFCPDNYNYSRFKLKDNVAVRSGSCIYTVS